MPIPKFENFLGGYIIKNRTTVIARIELVAAVLQLITFVLLVYFGFFEDTDDSPANNESSNTYLGKAKNLKFDFRSHLKEHYLTYITGGASIALVASAIIIIVSVHLVSFNKVILIFNKH